MRQRKTWVCGWAGETILVRLDASVLIRLTCDDGGTDGNQPGYAHYHASLCPPFARCSKINPSDATRLALALGARLRLRTAQNPMPRVPADAGRVAWCRLPGQLTGALHRRKVAEKGAAKVQSLVWLITFTFWRGLTICDCIAESLQNASGQGFIRGHSIIILIIMIYKYIRAVRMRGF